MKPKAPDDLWEQIDVLRKGLRFLSEPQGEGWFRPRQYAESRRIHPEVAKRQLNELSRQGKLERFQAASNQHVYYRIPSEGKRRLAKLLNTPSVLEHGRTGH